MGAQVAFGRKAAGAATEKLVQEVRDCGIALEASENSRVNDAALLKKSGHRCADDEGDG